MDAIPLLYGASCVLIGAAALPESVDAVRGLRAEGLLPKAALCALGGAATFASSVFSVDQAVLYWPAAALCMASALLFGGVCISQLRARPVLARRAFSSMTRGQRFIPRIGGE